MKSVGERIAALRRRKGVSQEELAFDLETSRQTVSNWETGITQPSIKNMHQLCEYFGVDASVFVDDGIVTAVAAQSVAEGPTAVQTNERESPSRFVWPHLIFIIGIVVCAFLAVIFTYNAVVEGLALFTPNKYVVYNFVSTYNAQEAYFSLYLVFGVLSLASAVLSTVFLIKKIKCKADLA